MGYCNAKNCECAFGTVGGYCQLTACPYYNLVRADSYKINSFGEIIDASDKKENNNMNNFDIKTVKVRIDDRDKLNDVRTYKMSENAAKAIIWFKDKYNLDFLITIEENEYESLDF